MCSTVKGPRGGRERGGRGGGGEGVYWPILASACAGRPEEGCSIRTWHWAGQAGEVSPLCGRQEITFISFYFSSPADHAVDINFGST